MCLSKMRASHKSKVKIFNVPGQQISETLLEGMNKGWSKMSCRCWCRSGDWYMKPTLTKPFTDPLCTAWKHLCSVSLFRNSYCNLCMQWWILVSGLIKALLFCLSTFILCCTFTPLYLRKILYFLYSTELFREL